MCPDDSVVVWMWVPVHEATKAAGLDLLLEPDVLVTDSLIGSQEPVTETDPGPMVVGEQNHDTGLVAGTHDPNLEVLGESVDERLPCRGSGGQRVASAPSGSKPLQILVFEALSQPP
jgi:hypothetical protein